MGFIWILPFLVEVEVVGFLGVATLLVPVTDECLGFIFAGIVRGLLDDEIPVHLLSYNYYY